MRACSLTTKAVTAADAIIAQQTAAFATGGDPSKQDGKGGKGKGPKGGKGKVPKGKGKGKGKGSPASTAPFVIPRDENGKVNGSGHVPMLVQEGRSRQRSAPLR